MPDDSRAIVEGKTKYENFYVHIANNGTNCE